MRCLGIPNTAHFANVTQIEDAMALWEKLKIQKFDEAWKPDQVKREKICRANFSSLQMTFEILKLHLFLTITILILLLLQEEEYEDSKGNVVNKKTYEDLKRQGLL